MKNYYAKLVLLLFCLCIVCFQYGSYLFTNKSSDFFVHEQTEISKITNEEVWCTIEITAFSLNNKRNSIIHIHKPSTQTLLLGLCFKEIVTPPPEA